MRQTEVFYYFCFCIDFSGMNTNSQQVYHEKIHRAVDYIEQHLSEEISLERLAAEACFSPFHFHRIFTVITGETPRDFIERVKLEKAANKLYVFPDKPIAEIATELGFSSASTFSRAFRKHFHIPPRDFLAKHINDFHLINVSGFQIQSYQDSKVCHFVKIEKLPARHVVYCQTLNGYATGIPKAWKKLLGAATLQDWLRPDTCYIGMPFDNPGVTPREKCRYRACISVDKQTTFSFREIKTFDLKGGNYALFQFRGKRQDISEAYAFVYGVWLPGSGYIPDHKPLIEIYPPELHACDYTEILEYKIALPVTLL